MVGAEPNVPAPDTRRRQLGSFFRGLAWGLVIDGAVIGFLVYLKARDTSDEPWETLAVGAFGALVCFSPLQIAVSGAFTLVRRFRWLSAGLVVAALLGAVALVLLAIWSSARSLTRMPS